MDYSKDSLQSYSENYPAILQNLYSPYNNYLQLSALPRPNEVTTNIYISEMHYIR